MILVLDCNIWVSLTINRRQIASCEALRSEITAVLARPKLRKFVPLESVPKVAKLHDLITKTYKLADIPKIVSDNKDNYLFALCAKSKADYLVSGDKIVLQINSHGQTKMITLSELERLIRFV